MAGSLKKWQLLGLFPRGRFSGGAGGAFTLTFTDSSVDAADSNIYTFASQTLGTADADRKIICAIGLRHDASNPTISSVSIGGVAATEVINISSFPNRASIFIADVPTGTTGDVVVTMSGAGTLRCGIGLWAMVGAGSSIASDTDSSLAEPGSVTLTVPTGGGAVGYSFVAGGAAGAAWTNLTERFDEVVESTVIQSGADTTSTGAIAMSVDWTSNPSAGQIAVFASWGP